MHGLGPGGRGDQRLADAGEATAVIEPTKLFDNLYYFGFNTVGGSAVPTSDGIIIIDALNRRRTRRM